MNDIANRLRAAAEAADALVAQGIPVHGGHTFSTSVNDPVVLFVARMPVNAIPVASRREQVVGMPYARRVLRARFGGVLIETVEHIPNAKQGESHVLH
ncbi:hypothetical protein V3390_00240 [Luteimonas sp. FXH3W]|uniref:Uncharacterized protein n=1 Tax=Aquilutibacter rugosus TaxID=3115820 RepID=A0ABU7UVS8_9GAMM